uniref:uncharacterized protein LOC120891552 n=1 Tax=Ictidomys tridecemlineatus TaxID=43179 RepID=UPI001A9CDFB3|nr:uncharacterized protein LOC120891552 [Ictidomys tridecemlineatus]
MPLSALLRVDLSFRGGIRFPLLLLGCWLMGGVAKHHRMALSKASSTPPRGLSTQAPTSHKGSAVTTRTALSFVFTEVGPSSASQGRLLWPGPPTLVCAEWVSSMPAGDSLPLANHPPGRDSLAVPTLMSLAVLLALWAPLDLSRVLYKCVWGEGPPAPRPVMTALIGSDLGVTSPASRELGGGQCWGRAGGLVWGWGDPRLPVVTAGRGARVQWGFWEN